MTLQRIDFYWFSGTGNTLLALRRLAATLRAAGVQVDLHPLESADPATLAPAGALGLAFPVAAFSTYPMIWRFIEALPPGHGTPVVMLATMGGFSGLLVGPLKKLLARKGYRPLAARQILMPGNYLRVKPREACARRIEKGLRQADRFAADLLAGRARWRRLSPWPYSWIRALWLKVEKSFAGAGRRFRVNSMLCNRCALCVRLCPVGNIALADDLPRYADRCQCCQRCIAYCPTRAITHSVAANGRYHAVPASDLLPPAPSRLSDLPSPR